MISKELNRESKKEQRGLYKASVQDLSLYERSYSIHQDSDSLFAVLCTSSTEAPL